MIRKLALLAAMALAVLAAMAPTASATGAVHVEDAEMVEVEGDGSLAVQQHTTMGEEDIIRCDNLWEASISEDGHVHVHDIDFSPGTGTTANCDTADDCGTEWEGQIHEDEVGGFEVHIDFCTTETGAGEVTCDITTTGAHCDDVDVEGLGGVVEVDGEVFFHEEIVLEHA